MILVSFAISATLISSQAATTSMSEDYWRNPRRCGLNCLYGYLNLHGREIELAPLAARLPLGKNGASLEDLRQAASDLGVNSSVVRMTDADLSRIPLPAIAHFDVRGGHFQLVLGVNSATITTADMSTGEILELSHATFLETWSGYLLIPGTSFEWQAFLTRLGVTVHGRSSAHETARPVQVPRSDGTGCDRKFASKQDVRYASTDRPC